jgi:hypothetical protein
VLLPLANSIASLLTGRMLMSRCVFWRNLGKLGTFQAGNKNLLRYAPFF